MTVSSDDDAFAHRNARLTKARETGARNLVSAYHQAMPAIHHLALRTADVESLARHYEDVCKLPRLEERESGAVWLAAAGVVLMLERSEPGESGPAAGCLDLLAFQLPPGDTLERAGQRLAQRGVALESRTEFTLYFRDPDGRRNALSAFAF